MNFKYVIKVLIHIREEMKGHFWFKTKVRMKNVVNQIKVRMKNVENGNKVRMKSVVQI